MNRVLAFFVAIFSFFASVFNWGGNVKINSDDFKDFEPVLRFVVSSDSHVKAAGDKGCDRIASMIKTGYAVAEASENYQKLDAVVLVGDMTNRGLKSQFTSMYSAVKSNLKDDTQFMGVVAKSHDCSTMGRKALSYYTDLTGLPTDFHNIINGYHFIGISASHDDSVHYSKEQITWLEREIASAVADDPAKPVFVFQHEHIYNTVYGSYPEDGWGNEYFIDVLSKYPNVIDISGHSHYPANDPRAIWQDTFTAINDGGLNYYEFTFDGKRPYHPESEDNMAQCLIVEVDANNRVRVTVYDLYSKNAMVNYIIENPADSSTFAYRQDNRKAESSAPVFPTDETVSIMKKCGKVNFTVPNAEVEDSNDDIVFAYSYVIKNSNGETVKSNKFLSDYYKNKTPEEICFSEKLPAGSYTLEVTAENAWGKVSAPLITEFNV